MFLMFDQAVRQFLTFVVMLQASQNFLMAKKEMSSLFKRHKDMKVRAEKSEASLKAKELDVERANPKVNIVELKRL